LTGEFFVPSKEDKRRGRIAERREKKRSGKGKKHDKKKEERGCSALRTLDQSKVKNKRCIDEKH